MTTASLRGLLLTALLSALTLTARAQVVEFRATINATQEVPATTSAATGSAIMLYDVGTNTFDLFITINGMTNALSASHIHEAAAGVSGPVVVPFANTSYALAGTTLSGTILRLPYTGDKLKLLQNGAYVNFHSAQFPGGEVRGQLIAQPKRLTAVINVAQEQATLAATAAPIASVGSGAAVMSYNPGTNRVSLRVSLFNLTNTFTNSHYHEGAPGVSGPVVTGLGAGTVAGYTSGGGGFYNGTFDIPYTGDPIRLLTGGAYLNFHTNVYAPGEIRGQVRASDEVAGSRMFATATRGFVGTGNQQLIGGISIVGPDPVRLLITAKGPSLAAYGVTGVLADPNLTLFDAAGRQIAFNENVGSLAGTELASIPSAPNNAAEAALLVVLPPGNYTAVVGGGSGTGVALLEAIDLRVVGATAAVASTLPDVVEVARASRTTAQVAPELCTVPMGALK